MRRPKFAVGDRVWCRMAFDGNKLIASKPGTVVALGEHHYPSDHKLYGIQFDDRIKGHTCELSPRKCKRGHGWWVPSTHLEKM